MHLSTHFHNTWGVVGAVLPRDKDSTYTKPCYSYHRVWTKPTGIETESRDTHMANHGTSWLSQGRCPRGVNPSERLITPSQLQVKDQACSSRAHCQSRGMLILPRHHLSPHSSTVSPPIDAENGSSHVGDLPVQLSRSPRVASFIFVYCFLLFIHS